VVITPALEIENAVPVLPEPIVNMVGVSPVVETVPQVVPDDTDSATLQDWLAVIVTPTSVMVMATVRVTAAVPSDTWMVRV
jgi:hypothetical protein